MINQQFRDKFKTELGDNFNYSPHVKIELMNNGALNRNGFPFSTQSIRNVFNGFQSEDAVELAILQVYQKRKLLRQERDKLMNEVK